MLRRPDAKLVHVTVASCFNAPSLIVVSLLESCHDEFKSLQRIDAFSQWTSKGDVTWAASRCFVGSVIEDLSPRWASQAFGPVLAARSCAGVGQSSTRARIVFSVIDAAHQSTMMGLAVAAFRACGLFPYNAAPC